MKLFRVAYWAVMAAAFLYSLYSGSRFSWLLFLVQALLLLAALGVNMWTAWSFSYIQELSSGQGEKGQTVGLHIGIYNDKPFPFTRMSVTVEAPDPAEKQTLPIDLAPNASCSFDLRLGLPLRGEFKVGMTKLELRDVFGLLPMGFDLRRLPYYRQRPLLVLPRVREFALPSGDGARTVESGGLSIGAGQEELASLREWAPGDRMSRIHWAATARTRTLFARQYEDPAGGRCLIYLDCRELSDEGADLLTECAATLLYAHLSQGDTVDLRSGVAKDVPPDRAFTLADLDPLRQWLALLKFRQKSADPEVLARAVGGERYGRVYVLGGGFDPELLRVLEALETACHYWLAEPLPAGAAGRRVRPAALDREELPAFLSRQLGEEQ